MVKLTELCFVMFLMNICESTLNLCESPKGYLEVEEGKQNSTFICSGLTVTASFSCSLDDSRAIGTCNATQLSQPCPGGVLPTLFSISRTDNTSTITVNETATTQKDVFKKSYLLCQTSTGTTKLEETLCQFDLIIPATGVVCSGEFNSILWALTGQCDVARAHSSRGRYYCLVYQISQKSPSVQSLVGNFTMSRPDTYVNGTCKINSTLPPEGNYSYNIIITPGQTQVLLSFTESSEIRRSSQPPSHNCPLYVEENDDVNCSCYTTDLGKPSGLVMWTENGSPELRLHKVNRTQNKQTYTCSLMWNNTGVLNVTYTLQVNYSSRVLTFKINNTDIATVNVSENTDMTVVCKADGRPTPNLSLFKNIDNQKLKLAVVNDSDELIHTMTAVTCQDAGSYVCQSENIIGVDTKSIQVFVFCSPRRLTNESYSTTLDGDEGSFEMIAYPDPDSLIIISNGSSLNDTNTTKLETNFSAEYQCTRDSLLLYKTTCDVIFRSKTVYTAGLYTAIFSNVFGNVSFTFEVKGELHPATKSTKSFGAPQITEENITVPVVGGVIGGVFFVVLVVAIIILVVRRKGTNKKETSQLTEAIEEEKQNEETETDVDKSGSQSPTIIGLTTNDVYSAVVKKGVKPTAPDSTDSAVSPTNKDVKSNKGKEKSKKTAGKGKKKEKETFSKSPKGASEYEIFGFDETQGQKMKGAKETKRRKEQNLNYTIVVFDDTLNTPTPTPTSDRTVYAEIVGGKMAKF